MRFTIATLAFTIYFLSCSEQTPSQRVNEDNLKTYFSTQVKEIDSTMTVENFKFIKLDTTTLKNQYIHVYSALIEKSEEYTNEIKRLSEKVKINRRLQNLSSDLDYSISKNYKEDADDDTKKSERVFR